MRRRSPSSDNFVIWQCEQIVSRADRVCRSGRSLVDWGTGRMTTPLYKLKAEFFKTLGHPARIRILELLVERDRSVGQLQAEVGLEASHMSQQLAVLRRSGVVDARKQGNSVIYSLASTD